MLINITPVEQRYSVCWFQVRTGYAALPGAHSCPSGRIVLNLCPALSYRLSVLAHTTPHCSRSKLVLSNPTSPHIYYAVTRTPLTSSTPCLFHYLFRINKMLQLQFTDASKHLQEKE